MIDIPTLVHDYVTGDRESESGKMWPSALGGCIRREMYRVQAFEETNPMPAEKRWQLHRFGWYERPIVEALRSLDGDGVVTQQRVEGECWSGRVDLLLGDHLVEIKSISPYGINRPGLPYRHHLWQTWCYAVLLQPPPGQVSIVYISRWTDGEVPEIRAFDATPGPDDITAVQIQMAEYERWYRQEELPPRPYGGPAEHAWDCLSYAWKDRLRKKLWEVRCPYFGHCWPGAVDPERGYDEPTAESGRHGLL